MIQEQVEQRGCGDIENLTVQDPELLALADPARARHVGLEDPAAFQP